MPPYELRHLTATLILDPEDAYARGRLTRGLHPRPIGPVSYRLVAHVPDVGARLQFEPPHELVVTRNPSGYDLFFGEIRRRDGGRARLGTTGRHVVRAESPLRLYQPAERSDVLLPAPDTPYLFDLHPGDAYPFPTETLPGGRGPTLVRGTYLEPGGRGIPDVTVRVPGQPHPATTDEDGRWTVVLPNEQPTGAITIGFRAPDGSVEEVPGVVVVAGRATSLRQTALRGWTVTAAGTPIGGAVIEVSGEPAPVTSRTDGSWSYHFRSSQHVPPGPGPAVTVTATLSDGRQQSSSQQVKPRTTVVVPTFVF